MKCSEISFLSNKKITNKIGKFYFKLKNISQTLILEKVADFCSIPSALQRIEVLNFSIINIHISRQYPASQRICNYLPFK